MDDIKVFQEMKQNFKKIIGLSIIMPVFVIILIALLVLWIVNSSDENYLWIFLGFLGCSTFISLILWIVCIVYSVKNISLVDDIKEYKDKDSLFAISISCIFVTFIAAIFGIITLSKLIERNKSNNKQNDQLV